MVRYWEYKGEKYKYDFNKEEPPVEKILQSARKYIEKKTGLKLRTSELVRLNQICQEVRAELVETEPIHGDNFTSVEEAMVRFMSENYGIDESNIDKWDELFELNPNTMEPSERIREYFRQQQEEKFKP